MEHLRNEGSSTYLPNNVIRSRCQLKATPFRSLVRQFFSDDMSKRDRLKRSETVIFGLLFVHLLPRNLEKKKPDSVLSPGPPSNQTPPKNPHLNPLLQKSNLFRQIINRVDLPSPAASQEAPLSSSRSRASSLGIVPQKSRQDAFQRSYRVIVFLN